MNGRRMSDKLYRVGFDLCIVRDGRRCAHCGWILGGKFTRFQRRHPVAKDIVLELNHVDGNPENNTPDNWNLLCTTCNLFWRPKTVKALKTGEAGDTETRRGELETKPTAAFQPAKGGQGATEPGEMTPEHPGPAKGHVGVEGMGEGERETVLEAEKASATRRVREEIPFREGETSMQANARYEPMFRIYCLTTVRSLKKVLWDDLESGGAEHVGCNTGTAARYLRKLTSPAGALMKVVEDGQRYVVMRPRVRAAMEVK